VEPQQLATKVAQLESRVATLEDEGKIVKGEVKQILTEIRSAILVRDNPFETEGGARGAAVVGATVIVSAPPEPAPRPEPVRERAPEPEPEPLHEPEPEPIDEPEPFPEPARPFAAEPAKEPVMLRPHQPQLEAVPQPPEPDKPQWSLLTIAGLSAWAEEAMRRLGSLRLEILLDLCEAAGHLTPEARVALSRVTELDITEPAQVPSTNETVVILRQLDALVNDDEDYGSLRRQRSA
jgi:outer membrane biosynthesis protein TonB